METTLREPGFPLHPDDDRPPEPTDGEHQLGSLLGEGGMGQVLLATDPALRREVAMKVLHAGAARDAGPLQRFVAEAQVTGQLEHPGIVPVHRLGQLADGRLYFTMKRIDGDSLAEHIERVREGRIPRDLPRLLRTFLQICEAMAFAHASGVIHRDLKPANVMVGPYGEVLVVDWGLAKVLADDGPDHVRSVQSVRSDCDDDDPLATQVGAILGTPAFMPPEQATGDHEALDERSDIYSLGGILHQLLSYRPPYEGPNVFMVLDRVVRGTRVRVGDHPDDPPTPPELVAIVDKAMAHAPSERYSVVRALVDDIERFLNGYSVSARRDNALVRLRKWLRRNPVFVAATLAAVAVAVSVVVMQRQARERRAVALISDARQQLADGDPVAAERSALASLTLAPTDRARDVLRDAAAAADHRRRRQADARRLRDLRERLASARAAADGLPEDAQRAEWYRALSDRLTAARALAAADPSARPDHASAALALARRLRDDGQWIVADLVLREAGATGLGDALYQAEAGALRDARTARQRHERQRAKTLIAELAEGNHLDEAIDDRVAELIRTPHAHVVVELVPAVAHPARPVRLLAIRALGRIGLTAPRARVDRARVIRVSTVTRDNPSLRREAVRLANAWLPGEDPRPLLDPVQVLSLRLIALAHDTESDEAIEIAWALGRLGDPRPAVLLTRFRDSAGNGSSLAERIAQPVAKLNAIKYEREVKRGGTLVLDHVLARTSALIAAGNAPEAIALLERIIRGSTVAPSHVYHALGKARLANGDTRAAIAAFDRAIALDPEAAELLVERARCWTALGDRTRARADLDASLKRKPTMVAYHARASLRHESGDTRGALADLDQGVKHAPRSAVLLTLRGRIRLESDNAAGALADLTRAIELVPDNARAHHYRGAARLALKDTAGALSDVRRALSLAPDEAVVAESAATVMLGARRIEEAVRVLDRWADDARNARRHEALLIRARAYLARGFGHQAIVDLQAALKAAPLKWPPRKSVTERCAQLLQQRSGARWKEGRRKDALADLDRAIGYLPGNPYLLVDRGNRRAELGQKARALADFQRALKVAPPGWPHRAMVEQRIAAIRNK